MFPNAHALDDGGIRAQVYALCQLGRAAHVGVGHEGAEIAQRGIVSHRAAQIEQHETPQGDVAGQNAALLDDAALADCDALGRLQGYPGVYQRRKTQVSRSQPSDHGRPAGGAAHGHGHGQWLGHRVEVGAGAQVGEARHGGRFGRLVVVEATHLPGRLGFVELLEQQQNLAAQPARPKNDERWDGLGNVVIRKK